jgi:hypothetical protein
MASHRTNRKNQRLHHACGVFFPMPLYLTTKTFKTRSQHTPCFLLGMKHTIEHKEQESNQPGRIRWCGSILGRKIAGCHYLCRLWARHVEKWSAAGFPQMLVSHSTSKTWCFSNFLTRTLKRQWFLPASLGYYFLPNIACEYLTPEET